MYLSHLSLREFRSYRRLDIDLPGSGLGIVGDNASGKSTLLEAISMLATTKSPRTSTDRELINIESGSGEGLQPYARVVGTVQHNGDETVVAIGMQLDTSEDVKLRKQVTVNGRPVRAADAIGTLRCVLFAPTDVELVSGSPANRRRYLDIFISQMDGRYLRSLSRFHRILEQRNGLLRTLSKDRAAISYGSAHEQLDYWNRELIAHGSIVAATRMRTIWILQGHAAERLKSFSNDESLSINYHSTLNEWNLVESRPELDLSRLEGLIAQLLEAQLADTESEELRRGVTLTGPHRDDFAMAMSGRDLATYGSRGQQRLAVVALKLAEADAMYEITEEQPVVLLDDVLSELDEGHRELLNRSVSQLGAQTILTSTERNLLLQSGIDLTKIATVKDGAIQLDGD
jgi:DNA replication and repair protein RecF